MDVDDASRWTSEIYALGEIDCAADLNCSNITLELLGTPVVAYGARSHRIEGAIHGLFPRYRSLTGIDYLADVLIGPRTGSVSNGGAARALSVRPGDSGALWLVEGAQSESKKEPLTPLAVNWGALQLTGAATSTAFALATFVSNACRMLKVDVVTNHNTGFEPIWGQAKHESIAQILCDVMSSLNAAAAHVLLNGTSPDRVIDTYRDLAYVPDRWKQMKGRGSEGPNHYANVDLHLTADPNRTLGKEQLLPSKWLAFYTASTEPSNRGALPFRIGQVYEEMSNFARSGDVQRFACAAGILMHYAADACNPAHVTMWGRGDPGWDGHSRSTFHSLWDGTGYDAKTITQHLRGTLKASSGSFADRMAVEKAVVKEMMRVQETLGLQPFADGLEADEGIQQARKSSKTAATRARVAECVELGCTLFWEIVQSAWGECKKPAKQWDQDTMHELYSDPDFLPSMGLEDLG